MEQPARMGFGATLRTTSRWILSVVIVLAGLTAAGWGAWSALYWLRFHTRDEALRFEEMVRATEQWAYQMSSFGAALGDAKPSPLTAAEAAAESDPLCYAPDESNPLAATLRRLACVKDAGFLALLRDGLLSSHAGDDERLRVLLAARVAFTIDPLAVIRADVEEHHVMFEADGETYFAPRPEFERLLPVGSEVRTRLDERGARERDPNRYAPASSLANAPTRSRIASVPDLSYLPTLVESLQQVHDGHPDAIRMMLEGGTAFAIDPETVRDPIVGAQHVSFKSNGAVLYAPRPEYERLVAHRTR